ncbi:hypothetical protein [Sulfuricurvum sp.]|uniref:hypothetical protein n=1 Tax=Sulfuricurvum sp. TaxID=2025608 RepID=UPI002614CA20|nr:hypothetical protein [Sulfuricurvum sp.]MDD2782092.1 hypothetical protein [Sulfuricurvum sp.]
MKFLMITIAWLLFNTTLFGVESINEQIEAIKNAPPAERVELMNRLKTQIAAMNEEDRSNALNALQQSRGGGNKLHLKLHQGRSGECGGSMQRLRLQNNSYSTQKLQGRQ